MCSPARIHKLKILSILFLNIFYLRTLCFFLILGVLGIESLKVVIIMKISAECDTILLIFSY